MDNLFKIKVVPNTVCLTCERDEETVRIDCIGVHKSMFELKTFDSIIYLPFQLNIPRVGSPLLKRKSEPKSEGKC
jgi:hypothetical protein